MCFAPYFKRCLKVKAQNKNFKNEAEAGLGEATTPENARRYAK